MADAQLAITFGSAMEGRVPNIPNAHRMGYVLVEADTYSEARQTVYALTEGIFAFDYPVEQILEQVPKYGLHLCGTVRDGVYHQAD